MSKSTMYAVVDYPIISKDEVAPAFFRAIKSEEITVCKSYEDAKDAAVDLLSNGSDEVGIIPIALDVDSVECVYSETIIKTVKLKK